MLRWRLWLQHRPTTEGRVSRTAPSKQATYFKCDPLTSPLSTSHVAHLTFDFPSSIVSTNEKENFPGIAHNAAPHKPPGFGRPAVLAPVEQPPDRGSRRCLRGHTMPDASCWHSSRAPPECHCASECYPSSVLGLGSPGRIRVQREAPGAPFLP